MRRPADGIDGFIQSIGSEHHLDLHFGVEVYLIFGSAIQLYMKLLASAPPHFRNGQACDPQFEQCILYLIQLKWLMMTVIIFIFLFLCWLI